MTAPPPEHFTPLSVFPEPPGDPGGPDEPARPGGRGGRGGWWRRRRTGTKVLICLLVLLLAGAGVVAGSVLWLQRKYDNNIERFGDPFTNIPQATRPEPAGDGALNVLLLGSDSRISGGDANDWARGAQRTDAIMIAHVPADRSGAQIISIPRDSWVTIPDHGKNKINAAFSYGGPALMVQTVEQLTRVRIDHVAIVDFTGFTQITDALGGVTIDVPEATENAGVKFREGPQRMDGGTALAYVRQRHNLPGGDFDRVKRQQNWIRAVAQETLDKGTLSNPFKVNSVLDSLTRSLATDDSFSIGEMRELAVSLRKVRTGDLTFLTAPVKGTGRAGKQSIVVLDTASGADLWKAVATDKVPAWLETHPDAALGTDVR